MGFNSGFKGITKYLYLVLNDIPKQKIILRYIRSRAQCGAPTCIHRNVDQIYLEYFET